MIGEPELPISNDGKKSMRELGHSFFDPDFNSPFKAFELRVMTFDFAESPSDTTTMEVAGPNR